MHTLVVFAMVMFCNGQHQCEPVQVAIMDSLTQCADEINAARVDSVKDNMYLVHAACRVAEVDKDGNVVSMSPLGEGD